jgi:hypothetical protein
MFTADTKDFTVQIDAFVEKAKGRAREFAQEFCNDIGEATVEATPVITGNLRASWWGSLNAPVVPQEGQGNVGNLSMVTSELQLGDVYYMNNGAAYAMRVEFGFVGTDSLGRKYNQAPRSFVRSTLDRASSIAEAAAQRVAAE